MSLKLYEIPKAYDDIFASLNEDGEITEDIAAQLDAINDVLQTKVENICHFVLDLQQDVEAIDSEIKRLQGRKKTFNNKVDWLKNYLLTNLQRLDMKKVETPTVTATVQNNPPAVRVTGDIPPEYKTAKLNMPGNLVPQDLDQYAVYEPDKTKIKNDIKAGKDVPGAELFQDVSLRIK